MKCDVYRYYRKFWMRFQHSNKPVIIFSNVCNVHSLFRANFNYYYYLKLLLLFSDVLFIILLRNAWYYICDTLILKNFHILVLLMKEIQNKFQWKNERIRLSAKMEYRNTSINRSYLYACLASDSAKNVII